MFQRHISKPKLSYLWYTVYQRWLIFALLEGRWNTKWLITLKPTDMSWWNFLWLWCGSITKLATPTLPRLVLISNICKKLGRLQNLSKKIFASKSWSPKLPKRGINIFNIERFQKKIWSLPLQPARISNNFVNGLEWSWIIQ